MDWSGPIEWLLTQGVLGIICLVLGFVVFRLYQACSKSEQGRLQDAKDALPLIETMKATLTAQLAATESRNRQSETIVEAVRAMDSRVDTLMQRSESNLQRAFERLDRMEKAWERHERSRERGE
jgi:hypothetical protein